jgi:hypothetical protein
MAVNEIEIVRWVTQKILRFADGSTSKELRKWSKNL